MTIPMPKRARGMRAGIAALGLLAVTIAQQACADGPWEGNWDTRYGQLRLYQDGERVYGDYAARGGIEAVSNADDTRLRGAFVYSDGRWGSIEFRRAGDQFQGSWQWSGSPLATEGVGTAWSGSRSGPVPDPLTFAAAERNLMPPELTATVDWLRAGGRTAPQVTPPLPQQTPFASDGGGPDTSGGLAGGYDLRMIDGVPYGHLVLSEPGPQGPALSGALSGLFPDLGSDAFSFEPLGAEAGRAEYVVRVQTSDGPRQGRLALAYSGTEDGHPRGVLFWEADVIAFLLEPDFAKAGPPPPGLLPNGPLRVGLRKVPDDQALVLREAPSRAAAVSGRLTRETPEIVLDTCSPDLDREAFGAVLADVQNDMLDLRWCLVRAGDAHGWVPGPYLVREADQ